MARTITVTADDYGLSRGITDTILETVDNGPVRRVSILANGEAVEYALGEYEKRKSHLELAVHLNLTEGKALSAPSLVPHLADADGRSRHSVASLWLSYVFAFPKAREAYRDEVRQEARLQIARILRATGASALAVNGHQHVHLIPFVADELALMPTVSSMRAVYEPPYFSGPFSLLHSIARPMLRVLSHRAPVAAKAGNDWFIGFLYAGRMTADRTQRGLRHIPSGAVEVLFHPGSARVGELKAWSASPSDLAWHISRDRMHEHDALLGPHFADAFGEPYSSGAVRFDRIVRFVISGGTATAVNLAALYALTEFAGVWYLYSATFGWCLGFLTSFVLQKFWTFEDSRADAATRQATAYVVLQALNAMLNAGGMYLLVSVLGIWYMLAQVLLGVALALWTYIILRRFIFRAPAVG